MLSVASQPSLLRSCSKVEQKRSPTQDMNALETARAVGNQTIVEILEEHAISGATTGDTERLVEAGVEDAALEQKDQQKEGDSTRPGT